MADVDEVLPVVTPPPGVLKKFANNELRYIRIMKKVSHKDKQQRRVVCIGGRYLLLTDPKSGRIRRLIGADQVTGCQHQYIPEKKCRNIVVMVDGEHDCALTQVTDKDNPQGSSADDREFVEKIGPWVKAVADKDIEVREVPLERDIITDADRERKPGYNDKRDKLLKDIKDAARDATKRKKNPEKYPPPVKEPELEPTKNPEEAAADESYKTHVGDTGHVIPCPDASSTGWPQVNYTPPAGINIVIPPSDDEEEEGAPAETTEDPPADPASFNQQPSVEGLAGGPYLSPIAQSFYQYPEAAAPQQFPSAGPSAAYDDTPRARLATPPGNGSIAHPQHPVLPCVITERQPGYGTPHTGTPAIGPYGSGTPHQGFGVSPLAAPAGVPAGSFGAPPAPGAPYSALPPPLGTSPSQGPTGYGAPQAVPGTHPALHGAQGVVPQQYPSAMGQLSMARAQGSASPQRSNLGSVYGSGARRVASVPVSEANPNMSPLARGRSGSPVGGMRASPQQQQALADTHAENAAMQEQIAALQGQLESLNDNIRNLARPKGRRHRPAGSVDGRGEDAMSNSASPARGGGGNGMVVPINNALMQDGGVKPTVLPPGKYLGPFPEGTPVQIQDLPDGMQNMTVTIPSPRGEARRLPVPEHAPLTVTDVGREALMTSQSQSPQPAPRGESQPQTQRGPHPHISEYLRQVNLPEFTRGVESASPPRQAECNAQLFEASPLGNLMTRPHPGWAGSPPQAQHGGPARGVTPPNAHQDQAAQSFAAAPQQGARMGETSNLNTVLQRAVKTTAAYRAAHGQ